ncbi:MAG TPA: Crp/Fnr family transcriptional regulator [Clostridiales bacterium]|nr:Crp/Fnr family transcriptional regulator [Clostridiales bacterium]
MINKWIKVLLNCRLFYGIDEEELENMLECLKPKISSYEKNEFAAISGNKYDGLGLVLSGSVAVTKENAAGDRIIIDILGPGEIFGEIAAFAGTEVWPATVIAQTACTVMYITPKIILGTCRKLCISHKHLISNMLNIVSKKALLLNQKVQYLSMKSIRGKISSYLLEQYKKERQTTFVMPMKRNELADFLNITRPSLSREMCRMRDEGVIEFYRESVKIMDLGALTSMAE